MHKKEKKTGKKDGRVSMADELKEEKKQNIHVLNETTHVNVCFQIVTFSKQKLRPITLHPQQTKNTQRVEWRRVSGS